MLSTCNNYKTVQHAATHHNRQNKNQVRVTFAVKKPSQQFVAAARPPAPPPTAEASCQVHNGPINEVSEAEQTSQLIYRPKHQPSLLIDAAACRLLLGSSTRVMSTTKTMPGKLGIL
jgi:hypothetical protein